jgi:hypothetical protein
MKKIYYPQNLATTISNTDLNSNFKSIGKEIYDYIIGPSINVEEIKSQLSKFIQARRNTNVAISSFGEEEGETSSFSTNEITKEFFDSLKISEQIILSDQVVDKIKSFFSVINNIDPILVITANYLYYDNINNTITPINKLNNPFYKVFSVSVTNPVDLDSFNVQQNFVIKTNRKHLKTFLIKFVFNNNPSILTDSIINLFVNSFTVALKEYINEKINNVYDYKHFAADKHTTKNLSYLNSKNLFYNIDSQYNFYVKQYENFFSSSTVSSLEGLIPNYYTTEKYLFSQEPEVVTNFVSLDGNIQNVTEETVLSNQYYLDYANTISSLSNDQLNSLTKIQNYLLDSFYGQEKNNPLSSENFPYACKITFSNYSNDPLVAVLQDKKLDTLIVNNSHYLFVNNQTVLDSSPFYVKEQAIKKTPSESGQYTDYDGKTYTLSYSEIIGTETVTNTKFDSIINFSTNESSAQAGFVVYPQTDLSFVSFANNQNLNLLSNPLSIFSYVYVNNRVQEISKNKLNYLNVLNFNLLDVYPVCFQIEKLSNNVTNNTISIARNAENSEITFYDTQLSYDKEYNYKIYSLNCVNEFVYAHTNVELFNANTITGQTKLTKNLKVYKNLVINTKTQIIDNPPTSIDVNIVPIIDKPKSMLFMLNVQSTSLLENPIAIFENDKTFFKMIRKKQNLNSKKVRFETVEDVIAVQVFRTTKPPKQYEDFRNNLYNTINLKNQTSISFIENLEQNVKYYYTFRSIDVHNNISNPTEVFEVQIINNDGAIYQVVNVYNMHNNNEIYNYQKSFKKYLCINPSAFFTEIIKQSDNTISIGSEENNDFWNNKFKIRIKSKNSGKVFDVNLKFKKDIRNLIQQTSDFNSEIQVISQAPQAFDTIILDSTI